MPLNMNKQHEFKMKLLERGESILDFCNTNNFDYNTFNQALNGFISMREEFQTAIDTIINN
jgi:hypothetical protein